MREKKDLKTIFAKNLKTKRKSQKLTQAELASIIGVSSSFITEIENGRKAPSFSNIEKLSQALNTPSWSFFLENEDLINLSLNEKDLLSYELKLKINKTLDDFFIEKTKK